MIREIEDKLFAALQKDNIVVKDGAVDEISFLASKYRIVYILKEVNGGEGWDLREYLYSGGRARTWDNIARWTEGILSWEKELPWQELAEGNEARRLQMLKKIAAVNLKKTAGSHTADAKAVYRAAIEQQELLKQQIAAYGADFVICCGTSQPFMEACYQGQSVHWQMTSRGVWYFIDGETVVIAFAHPEARVNDAYLFYALTDAVREIQRKRQENINEAEAFLPRFEG